MGCAHPHERRAHHARRRLSPAHTGQVPRHLDLWALRQGLAVSGWLQNRLAPHGHRLPRGGSGHQQQVPELGIGGPGKMGARRLCVRARRFARRGQLRGLSRRLVRPGGEGPVRVHRVGRRAGLVQRQGGPERHLLLRHEPVANRCLAAPAPGRHVRVGRGLGLLPRTVPPWRHLERFLWGLVPAPSQVGSVWGGRAR